MDGFVDSTVKGKIVLVVGKPEGRDVELAGAGLLVDAGEDVAKGSELGGADLFEGGAGRDFNGGKVNARCHFKYALGRRRRLNGASGCVEAQLISPQLQWS